MAPPDWSSRFRADAAERIVKGSKQAGFPSLLGMSVDELTPGRIVCSMEVGPSLFSGAGAVHGGAVASLVDHALALVVYPLVEPGKWVATTEFKVNYLGYVERGRLVAT